MIIFNPFSFFIINFDLKNYFSYFLVPNLRDERESCHNLVVKREYGLRSILAPKSINHGINRFHSMRKVLLRYSLVFPLLKKVDIRSRNYSNSY